MESFGFAIARWALSLGDTGERKSIWWQCTMARNVRGSKWSTLAEYILVKFYVRPECSWRKYYLNFFLFTKVVSTIQNSKQLTVIFWELVVWCAQPSLFISAVVLDRLSAFVGLIYSKLLKQKKKVAWEVAAWTKRTRKDNIHKCWG